jgi:putative sigma-54 modulation protein
MKLQVHSIHFDADQKLLDFIQKKADKLDTFFDRILGGEVYLRLEKGDSSKIKNKVVEVKLSVPGTSIFAKQEEASFEAAMDEAVESLKTQIKRHKDKLIAKS